jgi:hypothetical protein
MHVDIPSSGSFQPKAEVLVWLSSNEVFRVNHGKNSERCLQNVTEHWSIQESNDTSTRCANDRYLFVLYPEQSQTAAFYSLRVRGIRQ